MGIAAIAAVSVAAVGTAVSTYESVKQSKAEQATARKQRNIDRKIQELDVQRKTRQAISARNVEQARITSVAEATGLGGSSTAAGAAGSVGSQTSSNIGFGNTLAAATGYKADVGYAGLRESSQYGSKANIASGISNIALATFPFVKKG